MRRVRRASATTAIDAGLDVGWGALRWRVGYKERDNIGVGAGIAQALDPTGRSASRRFTSDLSWQAPNLPKDWELGVQASYMHYRELSDLVLFPAGSNLGLGFFADGVIGNPYKWERHARLNASTLYTGWQRHRIRLGAGFDRQALYKIRETKNFNPDFSPIGSGSRADVIDVSDTLPFIRAGRAQRALSLCAGRVELLEGLDADRRRAPRPLFRLRLARPTRVPRWSGKPPTT